MLRLLGFFGKDVVRGLYANMETDLVPPSVAEKFSPKLEDLLASPNIEAAWKRVKSNHGAPGPDGVTVDRVAAEFDVLWQPVEEAVRAGTYAPAGFREVPVPKPGGGERLLRIPSVVDRVVLQATAQVLEPVWEPVFSRHSYGYRKGRGPSDGVLAAATELDRGYVWAADVDIQSFFDCVDLGVAGELLREGIEDPGLLAHVLHCLKAGALIHSSAGAGAGLPQGSPLSPLLANIVLHEFDGFASQQDWHFVRYADDIVIFCETDARAKDALARTGEFLRERLHLELNPQKSQVVAAPEIRFLGFAYRRMADGKFRPCLSPESREAFRSRIIQITEFHPGLTFEHAAREAGAFFRQWISYFAYGGARALVPRESLCGFVRARLRGVQWLEWATEERRVSEMVARGVPEELARRDARRGLPTEEAARCGALSAALPNEDFACYGLAEPGGVSRARSGDKAKAVSRAPVTPPAFVPRQSNPTHAGKGHLSGTCTTFSAGGNCLEITLQPNGWLTLKIQTPRPIPQQP